MTVDVLRREWCVVPFLGFSFQQTSPSYWSKLQQPSLPHPLHIGNLHSDVTHLNLNIHHPPAKPPAFESKDAFSGHLNVDLAWNIDDDGSAMAPRNLFASNRDMVFTSTKLTQLKANQSLLSLHSTSEGGAVSSTQIFRLDPLASELIIGVKADGS